LYHSRRGELEEAELLMSRLYRRFRNDVETAGITAGVYKRLWLKDESNPRYLLMSHRAYASGWEASRRSDAYLGINAAATALWLGRPEKSREIAGDVQRILVQRADALSRHRDDANLVFDYWDHVTLAESLLLLGDRARARETYLAAFSEHAKQEGNIAVSRRQAVKILKAMGMPDAEAEGWLDQP
jgi:hypothetical protein